MNESICVYCDHFKDVAPPYSRTPMWRCELGTKARVTLDVCEDYRDDMKKTCSTCKQFLGFLGSEADKKYGFVSRDTCAKGALPKFVTHISEDLCEGFYSCDEWEERKPTNADMIRSLNDEDLLQELLKLIEREVACADCFRKTGEKRLRVWLSLEAGK